MVLQWRGRPVVQSYIKKYNRGGGALVSACVRINSSRKCWVRLIGLSIPTAYFVQSFWDYFLSISDSEILRRCQRHGTSLITGFPKASHMVAPGIDLPILGPLQNTVKAFWMGIERGNCPCAFRSKFIENKLPENNFLNYLVTKNLEKVSLLPTTNFINLYPWSIVFKTGTGNWILTSSKNPSIVLYLRKYLRMFLKYQFEYYLYDFIYLFYKVSECPK